MKKLFVILTGILLMIGVSSCNSCTNRSTEPTFNIADTVETVDSLCTKDTVVVDSLDFKEVNPDSPLGE